MSQLVFLLEEPSARAMLEGFLPKVLPQNTDCRFIVFEGKQDLEKQMTKRMRGYRVPNARFVVLRDKDSEDCRQVKSRLVQNCAAAGKAAALVRVACYELESWYLGDLAAVESGLGVTGLVRHQKTKPCAAPDDLPNPADSLSSMVPSYQKIAGSRAIGPHLDPSRNCSYSFRVFVAGIQKLTAS